MGSSAYSSVTDDQTQWSVGTAAHEGAHYICKKFNARVQNNGKYIGVIIRLTIPRIPITNTIF